MLTLILLAVGLVVVWTLGSDLRQGAFRRCTSTGRRDQSCRCYGCRSTRQTLALLTPEQRESYYRLDEPSEGGE